MSNFLSDLGGGRTGRMMCIIRRVNENVKLSGTNNIDQSEQILIKI